MSQACVIISAYNNAPAVKLALQGYLRQSSNDFRLIIADDGSSKDLLEAITPLMQQAAEQAQPLSAGIGTEPEDDSRAFRSASFSAYAASASFRHSTIACWIQLTKASDNVRVVFFFRFGSVTIGR